MWGATLNFSQAGITANLSNICYFPFIANTLYLTLNMRRFTGGIGVGYTERQTEISDLQQRSGMEVGHTDKPDR